jgi:CDP-glucose 4,6-dehydratase
VREVVEEILRHWPGSWEKVAQEKHLREAPLLSLAIGKAKTTLGWSPRWDFARTVAETVAWYREYHSGPCSMLDFTRKQIGSYCSGGL